MKIPWVLPEGDLLIGWMPLPVMQTTVSQHWGHQQHISKLQSKAN